MYVVYFDNFLNPFFCNLPVKLQGDLYLVRDEMRVTEEELEANRQIIKLLQKELDVMRVAMETRSADAGG